MAFVSFVAINNVLGVRTRVFILNSKILITLDMREWIMDWNLIKGSSQGYIYFFSLEKDE